MTDMFPSLPQIVTSLDRLGGVHPFFGYAFLGFKKARLPVGTLKPFKYSEIRHEILEKYYRLEGVDEQFFNPFYSTKKWVNDRYDSTSLQRIIADTFADAFIRDPASHEWGWAENYLHVLCSLMAQKSERVPLLDIAVWLYRKVPTQPLSKREAANEIIRRFIADFHLTGIELELLFDGVGSTREVELVLEPAQDRDLLNFIGFPDHYKADFPVALSRLSVHNVGPFRSIRYSASKRLNILAGDNSLGKTFLLELIWWSLTGAWNLLKADPLRSHTRVEIEMRFDMSVSSTLSVIVPFNRVANDWQRPELGFRDTVLYFGFDGNVTIFAPNSEGERRDTPAIIRFNRDQVWHGHKYFDVSGRQRALSNGLLHDVTMWQLMGDRYKERVEVFEKALRVLSPPEGTPLRLGRPTRIEGDSREIPTVKMSYGEVPFVHLSAGIQKAVSLAYVLVWTFFDLLEDRDYQPERKYGRTVVLLDEIEAHLHPKWQRKILPALLAALNEILPRSSFQIHVATHSPLVMASLETEYDPENDCIHVLSFADQDVTLESQPFVKHGTVNNWLESEIFGLGAARSKPGEEIVEQAKRLQLDRDASPESVKLLDVELRKVLPDDDPFWVRWNRFLEFRLHEGK